jgi:hypothetical protein
MMYRKKTIGILIVIMACTGVRGASLSEKGVLAWDLCAGWTAVSLAGYCVMEAGHQEYSRLTLEDRKSTKTIAVGFGLTNFVVGTNRLIHGNNRGAAIAYAESAAMGFACCRMMLWDRQLDLAQQKKPT